MKIELVNNLIFAHYQGIKWQIDQVNDQKSDQLWVATSHPDLLKLVQKLGLDPKKVYDIQANRYLEENFNNQNELYWSDLKLPNNAQRIVNDDWTISIFDQGQEIGRMKWFENSNRIVEEVSWLDIDGVLNRKETYQRDGQLFSVTYYNENEPLQIDYYFGLGQLKLTEFFYQNNINFVKDYGRNIESDNPDDYIKKVLDADSHGNQYTITMMGRELKFAPDRSTLKLPYSVIGEDNLVIPNLSNLINSKQTNIEKIIVDSKTYSRLSEQQLNSSIVDVVDRW